MCRMLAYAGMPVAPSELISAPPHSLLVQSYRPREMTSGVVNADGWGAALWLDDGKPEPAVYRSDAPIWSDPNLGWLGERLRARALVAAVRSATPGIGYGVENVQPFAHGPLAFAHNGFVTGFRQGPQRALRETLGRSAYETIQGSSDSEVLFALVLDALDRGADSLAAALRAGLAVLQRVCEEQDRDAVATVLIADGSQLVGARWAHKVSPASLYVTPWPPAPGARAAGFCMASEPIDSARWSEVPSAHLAIARPGKSVQVEPL